MTALSQPLLQEGETARRAIWALLSSRRPERHLRRGKDNPSLHGKHNTPALVLPTL
jgi:hypothetical protein